MINQVYRVQVLASYLKASVSDVGYASEDLTGRLLIFAIPVRDLFAEITKKQLHTSIVTEFHNCFISCHDHHLIYLLLLSNNAYPKFEEAPTL